MTKKRLSDLLRQEAQKSLDDHQPDASPPEPTENQPQSTTRRRSPQPKPAAAAKTPPKSTVKASVTSPAASSVNDPQQHDSQIIELKAAIASLEAALSQAQHTESSLRQEITHLELALQQQQELVQTLKQDLEQTNHDRLELTQTKQLILTLSDNNIKVTQELETLKQQALTPARSHSTNWELRKILEHPVQKEQPSTNFSDAEISWVD